MISTALAENVRDLQDSSTCQVTAIPEVRRSHHVLRIIHLLCQLGYSDSAELVRAAAGKGCEANHEEVKSGERNHVDGKFAQIGVELTRETETGRDARHDSRDEVVQVAIRWVCQLQGPHADVVKRLRVLVEVSIWEDGTHLVVDTEGLVGVFNQLVDGEGSVVGLHNCV